MKSEVLLAIALGLAVNEACDLSPWLADRMVRLAARVWTHDPVTAEVYREEWRAHIIDRPGKLLKLLTAVGFLAAAAARRGASLVTRRAPQLRRAVRFPSPERTRSILFGLGVVLMFGPLPIGILAGLSWTSRLAAWVVVPMVGALMTCVAAIHGVLTASADIEEPVLFAGRFGYPIRIASQPPSEFRGFYNDGLKSFDYASPMSERVRPYLGHSPTLSIEDPVGELVRPYSTACRGHWPSRCCPALVRHCCPLESSLLYCAAAATISARWSPENPSYARLIAASTADAHQDCGAEPRLPPMTAQ